MDAASDSDFIPDHEGIDDDCYQENDAQLDELDEELEGLEKDAKRKIPKRVPRHRMTYSETDRKAVLLFCEEECKGNQSEAARQISTVVQGMHNLKRQYISRWRKKKCFNRRGRKVNFHFEEAILDALMDRTLAPDKDGNMQKHLVSANVMHSRDLIKKAAQKVQTLPEFCDLPAISKLRFSDGWITRFLNRNRLGRRRITGATKAFPPPSECQAFFKDLQRELVGVSLENIINADETGVNYGCNPRYQFVLKSPPRDLAPDLNKKARFTALLWGSAAGTLHPAFVIIKCATKSKVDLTTTEPNPSKAA